MPIAGVGRAVGCHIQTWSERQRDGAVLIGAQPLDAQRAIAGIHLFLRVAVTIAVAHLKNPQGRPDRLQERCSGRGSAAVVRREQHVGAQPVGVKAQQRGLLRRLDIAGQQDRPTARADAQAVA